jgi:hypothetical protein
MMHTVQRRESLVHIAKQAGISVPENLYACKDEFPHWNLFCMIQLDRPVNSEDAPLHNAKIIASVEDDRIRSLKFGDIDNLLK